MMILDVYMWSRIDDVREYNEHDIRSENNQLNNARPTPLMHCGCHVLGRT